MCLDEKFSYVISGVSYIARSVLRQIMFCASAQDAESTCTQNWLRPYSDFINWLITVFCWSFASLYFTGSWTSTYCLFRVNKILNSVLHFYPSETSSNPKIDLKVARVIEVTSPYGTRESFALLRQKNTIKLLTVIPLMRHIWRNRFSALGLFFRIDCK